jgi:hypothetical protein
MNIISWVSIMSSNKTGGASLITFKHILIESAFLRGWRRAPGDKYIRSFNALFCAAGATRSQE